MPVKLIVFILTLVVIVSFIGFNIENVSDIKLLPGEKGTLNDVPIFLSFFVMYVIGVLSVIPFFISRQFKKNKSSKPLNKDSETAPDAPKKKVRVLGSKKGQKKVFGDSSADNETEDESRSEEEAEEDEIS